MDFRTYYKTPDIENLVVKSAVRKKGSLLLSINKEKCILVMLKELMQP